VYAPTPLQSFCSARRRSISAQVPLDVLPVGKHAEEAELVREGALCARGQGAEVYVELAGEPAAFFACSGDGDAGRGDGQDTYLCISLGESL
jgi:hypothetical protein